MPDKKNKNLRGLVMRQTRRHPRDVDGKAFIFRRKRPQKAQLVSQKYGTQENRKRHQVNDPQNQRKRPQKEDTQEKKGSIFPSKRIPRSNGNGPQKPGCAHTRHFRNSICT